MCVSLLQPFWWQREREVKPAEQSPKAFQQSKVGQDPWESEQMKREAAQMFVCTLHCHPLPTGPLTGPTWVTERAGNAFTQLKLEKKVTLGKCIEGAKLGFSESLKHTFG